MRLIDAERFEELFNQQVELGATDLFDAVEDALQDTESIDPETLPIVKELREQLARVTAERDAAITDMEALMWFSGEGCKICNHCTVVHKTPYVRYGCDLRPEKDCTPKWRGIQEVQNDE